MSSVLERLREALPPELQVEREIASGGMGIVFAARDTTLDRPVAIKILRPEQATARAAEKFLREARILANLRHPNVIPVHNAGEAGGFFYYVMDLVTDSTLAERLKEGPLPQTDVLKLGRDLLDALEPVHDQGVVHRDIKPSNIFLIGNRAVLTDFGIARPSKDPMDITATEGSVTGTIGYMPPEQAYGQAVTGRTDLYAVGMVLYEAYTGNRWSDTPPDAKANWSGVPTRVVPVLKQALAWEPDKRWPDAATFRRALWHTRTLRYKRYKWYATAIAATTLAIGFLLGVFVLRPTRPSTELAILPFSAGPGVDDSVATNLRELTRFHLNHHLRELGGVPLHRDIDVWWYENGSTLDSVDSDVLDGFGVRSAAFAGLELEGDSVVVTIRVVQRRGRSTLAGTVRIPREGHNQEAAFRIGFQIAREIDPGHEYQGSPALAGQSDVSVNALLAGLRAVRRSAFRTAEGHFRTAISEDSAFGLAAWWLHNAWRWRVTGEPEASVDLRALLARYGTTLPTSDRMLIEAQLAPSAARRFEIYREITERYPNDGKAASIYAEELLNRGALSGIPLESTIRDLETAVERDPTFGPAVGNLLWAYIRVGNRESATRMLQRYSEISAGPDETDVDRVLLLGFAFAERFFPPDSLAAARMEMQEQPGNATQTLTNLRLATLLGLPNTQAELAASFLSSGQLPREVRASMLEARGLALVGLGQMRSAFAHLDSAALLFAVPGARLEAAEWRIVTRLVGMPGIQSGDSDTATEVLSGLEYDPGVEHRVAWALGLDAITRGDSEAVDRWTTTLRAGRPDTVAARLGTLLESLQQASGGFLQRALEASAPLLAFDSAAQVGDPFARAVLHMKRAEWLDSIGNPEAADSTRLWYEHFEAISIPTGEAVAADIDWALGTFARWQRGTNATSRGDSRSACLHLPRVIELWEFADEPFATLRDSAQATVANLGCSP